MNETLTPSNQIKQITKHISANSGQQLIAIAGAPASGKSTLAAELMRAFGDRAVVIPMDGFHLDNSELIKMGLQDRKGCPESFDARGFIALLRQIKAGGRPNFPLFDRGQDRAIKGAGQISAKHRIFIFEGNYLLLDEDPWRELYDLFDLRVFLDVPPDLLLDRLVARWIQHGLSPKDAHRRASQNDMVNQARVLQNMLPADQTLVPQQSP